MMEFTKKNKNILLSSSIFIGINSNIYCECCKGKKCSGDKKNATLENNDSTTTTENPDPKGNPDPQKDQNPPQNPDPSKPGETPGEKPPIPGKNPTKTPFELKKEELLKKIEDLKKLCPGCEGMSRTIEGKKEYYDQVYLEELKKIQKDINSLVDNGKTFFNSYECEINTVEKNIKGTLKKLFGDSDIYELKVSNESKLTELLKKIQLEINNESKKDEFDKELRDLDSKNNDINNVGIVKNSIKELEKKINDQLNKENSNRKDEDSGIKDIDNKRTNVSQLLKNLEDLKLKILKKIDLQITNDKITDATTIEELNNIENNLNTKKTEIKKIIDDQNKIYNNQNEFSDSFSKRKVEIADVFFINDEFKTHLKNNNPTDEEISDYFKMYSEMTGNNEVFNHQIALDLQIYRYILKLEGFVDALNNIFDKNTQYWFLYLFSKSDANTSRFSVIKTAENTYEIGISLNKDKCLKVNSGDFCVENKKFKYVRYEDGCKNSKDCISCKLRKLLKDEECLDLFLNIYKQQGESSSSSEAMLMKRILFTGLKNDKQNLESYYSTISKSKLEKFKKDVDPNFIKCVMIEWALTIEFMKKFIPKYYNGSDNFNLYRTFGPGDNDFFNLDTIKHDLYESTCLIAPAFIPEDPKHNIDEVKLCSFTKTKNPVKYYRCFFNHIISPSNECILKGDYEHEIGFIGINEKYERISDKTGKDYIEEYDNFLKNATFDNATKNLPEADKISI